eukprot:3731424-Amphidinium_carterae.1
MSARAGLTVTCIYGNYQDNLAAAEGGKLNIEKPTMVVMFNPGLGQPIRRNPHCAHQEPKHRTTTENWEN